MSDDLVMILTRCRDEVAALAAPEASDHRRNLAVYEALTNLIQRNIERPVLNDHDRDQAYDDAAMAHHRRGLGR